MKSLQAPDNGDRPQPHAQIFSYFREFRAPEVSNIWGRKIFGEKIPYYSMPYMAYAQLGRNLWVETGYLFTRWDFQPSFKGVPISQSGEVGTSKRTNLPLSELEWRQSSLTKNISHSSRLDKRILTPLLSYQTTEIHCDPYPPLSSRYLYLPV